MPAVSGACPPCRPLEVEDGNTKTGAQKRDQGPLMKGLRGRGRAGRNSAVTEDRGGFEAWGGGPPGSPLIRGRKQLASKQRAGTRGPRLTNHHRGPLPPRQGPTHFGHARGNEPCQARLNKRPSVPNGIEAPRNCPVRAWRSLAEAPSPAPQQGLPRSAERARLKPRNQTHCQGRIPTRRNRRSTGEPKGERGPNRGGTIVFGPHCARGPQTAHGGKGGRSTRAPAAFSRNRKAAPDAPCNGIRQRIRLLALPFGREKAGPPSETAGPANTTGKPADIGPGLRTRNRSGEPGPGGGSNEHGSDSDHVGGGITPTTSRQQGSCWQTPARGRAARDDSSVPELMVPPPGKHFPRPRARPAPTTC